jgi:hypothetical protein
LVEKWIPPSRSETAEIGKKTEGILGVKKVTFQTHSNKSCPKIVNILFVSNLEGILNFKFQLSSIGNSIGDSHCIDRI